MKSEALRVDVDDGRHALSPHRRRCGGKELGDPRGDRARAPSLREQLCPVSAAKTEERRRAEHVVAYACGDLSEQLHRTARLRSRRDDADEMAKRRVAELPPALELLDEEPRHVVPRGMDDRPGIGLEGLDENLAGRIATAPAGKLRQE